MFFLIPIGSEEGVRRLPYLTISLIVLNTLIYFITSAMISGQMREFEDLEQQLYEIESYYLWEIVGDDPAQLDALDYEGFRQRILAGEVIPQNTEDYDEWLALYEKYDSALNKNVYNQFGFTPSKFNVVTLFTSMFIHGGFFHLLFNMLFLWLVGCNIEDDWSWKVFLGVYLMSGVVATLAHMAFFPKSSIPLVGASGAIAGVMGAFMIRRYKTKIRFAYFIWFFFRPFLGTFAVYAGFALPIWFLMEVFYAATWSVESGTAHWAHIGGFVFGAVVSSSFKFFGLEKKYIEPMVEDSFEKLKVSPKMKEANKKLETGDTAAAVPLFLAIMGEEPNNYDAPLTLARLYYEKGKHGDAAVMYDRAFGIILRMNDVHLVEATYDEMKEKKLTHALSEKNFFNYALFLEKHGEWGKAVEMFGRYVKLFPEGKVRAKAIYRTYLLFRDRLENAAMASSALAYLKKEHPEYPVENP